MKIMKKEISLDIGRSKRSTNLGQKTVSNHRDIQDIIKSDDRYCSYYREQIVIEKKKLIKPDISENRESLTIMLRIKC